MDTPNPARLADWVEHWRPRVPDLVLHDPDGPAECLYRAGQLLVDAAAADRVAVELRRWVDRVEPGGLVRLRPAARARCPALAADLAGRWPAVPHPVAPNHVHVGSPIMLGTPTWLAGPEVDGAAPPPPPHVVWDPPVTVAVLDTGLDPHPWFAGRPWLAEWGLQPEVLDLDTDGSPDRQAGHGTFVAGVVLRHAPGVTLRHHRVLSSMGLTDDATVAAALRAVRDRGPVDVVLLTAGCHTADDHCPPVLRREVERFGGTVLVAAAGNSGSTRPFWPAACERVVAVGAADGAGALAPFSNRGPWVDATAPGVDVVSSFVRLAQGVPGVAPGTETRRYGTARWSGTSFAAPKIAADVANALHNGHFSSPVAGWRSLARRSV